MNTGKALLGVLVGMAAGTVIGMLLAPEKEEESRKNRSKENEDLADALNEKIDQKFADLMNTVYGEMRKGAK